MLALLKIWHALVAAVTRNHTFRIVRARFGDRDCQSKTCLNNCLAFTASGHSPILGALVLQCCPEHYVDITAPLKPSILRKSGAQEDHLPGQFRPCLLQVVAQPTRSWKAMNQSQSLLRLSWPPSQW
jgi:hypothetical protein